MNSILLVLIIVFTGISVAFFIKGLGMKHNIMLDKIFDVEHGTTHTVRASLLREVRKAYCKWYNDAYGIPHITVSQPKMKKYVDHYAKHWQPLKEAIMHILEDVDNEE